MKHVMLVAVLTGSLVGSAADPNLGDAWYVSTESLVLRARPDSLSERVDALKYGDRVTIRGLVKVGVPFDGNQAFDDMLPHWAKVETGGRTGYLPVASLASEWLKDNQDPSKLVSTNGSLVARRGFSETEDDDLRSMRGAAGAGRASRRTNLSQVGKILSARKEVSESELANFMADGALEADKKREVADLKAEEAGFFGGFFKDVGKKTSGLIGFASGLAGAVAGTNQLIRTAASAAKLTSDVVYSEVGPVQEMQVGRVVAARVLPSYPPLEEDHPASVYVRRVGAMLAAASNDPTPYDGYTFLTVRSDEVNAFAIPGGFVLVTTGMLKFLKDEDELVAILGHEMGHMELRHGIKSVGKEDVLKLFSLAAAVGTVVAADQTAVAVRRQVTVLACALFGQMTSSVRNGYGKDMESEADWRSIQFSASLGYDTRALYDVLERFKATKGTYGGASYPEARGVDVLGYRRGYGCKGDEPAPGREIRAARYKAACAF